MTFSFFPKAAASAFKCYSWTRLFGRNNLVGFYLSPYHRPISNFPLSADNYIMYAVEGLGFRVKGASASMCIFISELSGPMTAMVEAVLGRATPRRITK